MHIPTESASISATSKLLYGRNCCITSVKTAIATPNNIDNNNRGNLLVLFIILYRKIGIGTNKHACTNLSTGIFSNGQYKSNLEMLPLGRLVSRYNKQAMYMMNNIVFVFFPMYMLNM